MYGETVATTAALGGGSLAMTGLSIGNGVLLALGLVFAGLAVIALVRRHAKARP